MRRHRLFLEPADGQHAAAQRNLAGHGHVAAHRRAGERAHDGRGQRDAGGRTVLGRRPGRKVHVHVPRAREIRRDAEDLGA